MDKQKKRYEHALGLAARAWCGENTSNKIMDVELAEEFAKILVKEMYEPRLGFATTGELIEEIKARIKFGHSSLSYKTIDYDVEDPLNDFPHLAGQKELTTFKMTPPPSAEYININFSIIDKNIKCNCGVDSVGGGMHSNWCDKGKNNG